VAQTNVAAVSSHILSELMGSALAPLFRRYMALRLLNRSNTDGEAGLKRKIPVEDAIDAAYADVEGQEPGNATALSHASAIEATPSAYVQFIQLTMKAIRRVMPGATRESVIAAIESGSPESLALIARAVSLSLDAHLRAAEIQALGLASTFTRTSGTTNTVLSAAAMLDAITTYRAGTITALSKQGSPSNLKTAFVLDAIGVGQLVNVLQSGSGTGLAALWANASKGDMVMLGDASVIDIESGLAGYWNGTPVLMCDSALQAQDATDRFGMHVAIGSGETAEPGSERGAGEFCEGHTPSVEFARHIENDVVNVVSRWEWAVVKHTDLHGQRMIYKKTLT
jgi:hypothetical protein